MNFLPPEIQTDTSQMDTMVTSYFSYVSSFLSAWQTYINLPCNEAEEGEEAKGTVATFPGAASILDKSRGAVDK